MTDWTGLVLARLNNEGDEEDAEETRHYPYGRLRSPSIESNLGLHRHRADTFASLLLQLR